MAKKKFYAREGSPYTDKEANIVGTEMDKMYASGIIVTSKSLLTQAKKRGNPLHKFFDWNDKTAAEKSRIELARQLIGAVQIIEIRIRKPARAYLSIKKIKASPGNPRRRFEPREIVLSDQDYRAKLAFEYYERVASIINSVESMGLEKDYRKWNNIIISVRANAIEEVEKRSTRTKKRKRKAG